MFLSVEMTMGHANCGVVSLEDTIPVTADKREFYGGSARGWNIARL